MFKKRAAALAVRRNDVCKLQQCDKSTVRKYLHSHSHIDIFPNKLQSYLEGPMTTGMQTKLLFKAGFAPVRHMQARKCRSAADGPPDASCPFCTCQDETASHFALECPQFAEWCADKHAGLSEDVDERAFAEWDALPADKKLAARLNDHRWGNAATGVDYIAQHYLSDIVQERVARLSSDHPLHTSRRHSMAGCPHV
jgi:hypothetical protein